MACKSPPKRIKTWPSNGLLLPAPGRLRCSRPPGRSSLCLRDPSKSTLLLPRRPVRCSPTRCAAFWRLRPLAAARCRPGCARPSPARSIAAHGAEDIEFDSAQRFTRGVLFASYLQDWRGGRDSNPQQPISKTDVFDDWAERCTSIASAATLFRYLCSVSEHAAA